VLRLEGLEPVPGDMTDVLWIFVCQEVTRLALIVSSLELFFSSLNAPGQIIYKMAVDELLASKTGK
jgi:hypothetical protein